MNSNPSTTTPETHPATATFDVWANRIQGRWESLKGVVMKNWGMLTDDDIAQVRGDREKLIGKLMSKYGLTREEALAQIDSFQAAID